MIKFQEISTIFKEEGVSYVRRYNEVRKGDETINGYRRIKYYDLSGVTSKAEKRIEEFLDDHDDVIHFEFTETKREYCTGYSTSSAVVLNLEIKTYLL